MLSGSIFAMQKPLTDDEIVLGQAAIIAKQSLFKAIENQNIGKVKIQLDFIKNVLKMKPDFTDNFGDTPLIAALTLNTDVGDEIAELLIKAGADVNKPDATNNDTPLHIAIMAANLDLAERLIFSGADLTKRNAQGRTPKELTIFLAQQLRNNGDPNNKISIYSKLYKLLSTKSFRGA